MTFMMTMKMMMTFSLLELQRLVEVVGKRLRLDKTSPDWEVIPTNRQHVEEVAHQVVAEAHLGALQVHQVAVEVQALHHEQVHQVVLRLHRKPLDAKLQLMIFRMEKLGRFAKFQVVHPLQMLKHAQQRRQSQLVAGGQLGSRKHR
jgi:hypothetical protein